MLIRFAASNYRSIKERIELSMTANYRRGLADPTQAGFYSKAWRLRLLPALAIFGPNSSGKSNVISALSDFIRISYHGHVDKTDDLDRRIVPYSLDSHSTKSPVVMEGEFLIKEVKCRYHLKLLGREIVGEEFAITKTRTSEEYVLFKRRKVESDAAHAWDWGKRGKMALNHEHRALAKNLKKEKTFLSVLASAYTIPTLSDFATFLINNPVIVNSSSEHIHRMHVYALLEENPKFLSALSKMLKMFDIPFDSLRVENKELKFLRKSERRVAREFSVGDESDGTRQLIALSETILHGLCAGGVVFIDELDAHLHPFLAHLIVSIFQNPTANPKCAQIVFTTHDTNLMDLKLLRKEQIYLVTYREGSGSIVESVASYELRNEASLARSYMDGRLSGLPRLGYEKEIASEIREMVLSDDPRQK